jgi:hypothetical protein
MSARRLHLALGVTDIAASVRDYSQRLGAAPQLVVDGEYALWRTQCLNVSIRRADVSGLRHLGWEDESAQDFTREPDVNGIVWERFSARQQTQEIRNLWPQASMEIH